MTIYLLNTTILTTPGLTYHSKRIGLTEAKSMLGSAVTEHDVRADNAAGLTPVHVYADRSMTVVSAIGHAATADIASTLLGRDVLVSREAIAMQAGDLAICVKLRGRPAEGAILTREEVEAIGYDLVLLRAEDPAAGSRQHRLRDDVMALLCYPDDDSGLTQPCGTRRRGRWPMQAHYIMRRPEVYGGGYVRVTQEWGTDEWSVADISLTEAALEYHIE